MNKFLKDALTTNVNNMPCVMMDLNLDGSVNIVDVIGVVNIIIGLSNPTETQLCSADINADGTVNIVDVIAIVNTIISL